MPVTNVDEYSECPKCGNSKHHDVLRVEIEGKESRIFKCKACGHTEYEMPPVEEDKEKEKIEKMGNAFREFLSSKNKNGKTQSRKETSSSREDEYQ